MVNAAVINSRVANSGNPLPPAPATAVGFNRLTLYDDFTSTVTVDLNNTGAPGFFWYVTGTVWHGTGPFPTAASAFSQVGSVLTINPASGQNWAMATRGFINDGTGDYKPTVGPGPFAAGGYLEVRMSYPISGTTGWPQIVLYDQNGVYLQKSPTEVPDHFGEIDVMEFFQGGLIFSVHDWPTTHSNFSNNNNVINVGSPDVTKMNTYGIRWRTQAQNGGTGLIERFVNGTHYAAGDISYSASTISPQSSDGPTGVFSIFDAMQMLIVLGTGTGQPLNVDYVMLWQ